MAATFFNYFRNETDTESDEICPGNINCSHSNRTSFDIGETPSYIAIISSSLSCLGSLLIFVAFLAFKDLRTPAQKIITQLALADFISAAGYIVGSSNFITHFKETDHHKCSVFKIICEVQASVTSYSSLCSFWWTLILAFYLYMVIVYNRRALVAKLFPLYNLLAWGIPLLIIVPLAALRKLGYAPYAASNWCFVKSPDYSTDKNDLRANYKVIVFILVAGKFWEILTYIAVIIIYVHITGHLSKVLLNSLTNHNKCAVLILSCIPPDVYRA